MTDNTRIEEILEKGPDPDNYTIASVVYQKETSNDINRLQERVERFVKESFWPAYQHAMDLTKNDHPKFKGRVLNPWFIDSLHSHIEILTSQQRVTDLLEQVGKDRMIVTLMVKGETRNAGNWSVSPKGTITVEVFNNSDRYPSDGKPRKSGMISVFQLEVPIFLSMGN